MYYCALSAVRVVGSRVLCAVPATQAPRAAAASVGSGAAGRGLALAMCCPALLRERLAALFSGPEGEGGASGDEEEGGGGDDSSSSEEEGEEEEEEEDAAMQNDA